MTAHRNVTAVFKENLGIALGAASLRWTTGGNADWKSERFVTKNEGVAVQSGTITSNQSSWVETTVVGPGTLSWWWKVSSESGYDKLTFTINGVSPAAVPAISGEVDWVQRNVAIPTGSQALRWTYAKDAAVTGGQDTAWLDTVQFTKTAAIANAQIAAATPAQASKAARISAASPVSASAVTLLQTPDPSGKTTHIPNTSGLATGGVYVGLINPNPSSASKIGLVEFAFNASGSFTGKLTFGGKPFSFAGQLDSQGNIPAFTFGTGVTALRLNPQWSSGEQVVGTVTQGNLPFAFAAARCPYSSGFPVAAGWQGKFTGKLALQGTSSANPTLSGMGFVTLVVSATGNVTYSGKLADGTNFSGGGPLSLGLGLVIYVPLYTAQQGAIGGTITFAQPTAPDFAGSGKWFRSSATGTALFAPGWPGGLALIVTGSQYAPPAAATATKPAVLPLPNLPNPDTDGNVTLSLSLGAGGVARKLNLSKTGAFTVMPPLVTGETLSLSLTVASGLFTGSYRPNAAAKTFTIGGVLLQKTQDGAGFALDPAESAQVGLQLAP
jgi:hypothetical protein